MNDSLHSRHITSSPLFDASQPPLVSTSTSPLGKSSGPPFIPYGQDPSHEDVPEEGPLLAPKAERSLSLLNLDKPTIRDRGLLSTPRPQPTTGYLPELHELNSPRKRAPLLPSEGRPAYTPRHPFSKQFEAPEYTLLIVHVVLVACAWPALKLTTLVAEGHGLTEARFIVGLGCTIVGYSLSGSLTGLAKKWLEAASETFTTFPRAFH